MVCAYTLIAWGPAFFGRAYGWNHALIGVVLAGGQICGAVGNVAWGALVDHISRKGHGDGVFRLYIPMLLLAPPVTLLAFVVREPLLSLPAFGLASLVYMGFGPAMAAGQLASPDYLRGRITGLKAVATSTIGLGVGPVLAGLVTDQVFHDRAMLGPAMSVAIFGASLVGALSLALGRKGYLRALAAQEANLAAGRG